jgi:hypothetical protein
MEDWPAYTKRILGYLQQVHGTATVSIQDGRDADLHYEGNQKFSRKGLIFSDFIERLKQTESSNNFYVSAGNMVQYIESLAKVSLTVIR